MTMSSVNLGFPQPPSLICPGPQSLYRPIYSGWSNLWPMTNYTTSGLIFDASSSQDHFDFGNFFIPKTFLWNENLYYTHNSGYMNVYSGFPNYETNAVQNGDNNYYIGEDIVGPGYRDTQKVRGVPLSLTSKSSFHLGYFVPPTVAKGDLYGGIFEIWAEHFKVLFTILPHEWSLSPASSSEKITGFEFSRDMAKVRFLCQTCYKGWTSMNGSVHFYYKFDRKSSRGELKFYLTRQQCQKCVGEMQTPMWYPEEAQKVINNIFHEICSKIYFLPRPPPITERRAGQPKHRHQALGCEDCAIDGCRSKIES